jgi:hypothetical protein
METCKTIFALIGKSSELRSYEDVTETPRRDRNARHLDSVISERESFAKNRAFTAQMLDEALDAGLLPVHKFLRAARRSPGEQFIFPDPEARILASINVLRDALDRVEEMVVGNSDKDATAPESANEDPDVMLVAVEQEGGEERKSPLL